MIVVDTSALVAIMIGEPEAGPFGRILTAASEKCMSAANYAELQIVMLRRTRADDPGIVPDALTKSGVTIVPVERQHAELAAQAYRGFGKGRHPAALNFGDCFSYALAKALDAPLLYKGTDFAATDVASASAV